MALKKTIELDNGITVNYHRIRSINKITNKTILIEVTSYISEEKRQEEIDYYNSKEEEKQMNVFMLTKFINIEYSEDKTIKDLYALLKETEPFKGAIDV